MGEENIPKLELKRSKRNIYDFVLCLGLETFVLAWNPMNDESSMFLVILYE